MPKIHKQTKFKHWQVVAIVLAFYDAITVMLAFFAALWLRSDCRIAAIEEDYWHPFI